ncbi:hypothetical protein BCR43DRAFT_490681 [Syncephalastrum racemosum]|uniref:Uncharacterized protein n=1 Tax=Syncephalastrum racemosum TaxID=13706 RepID=A0A1X2HGG5_SYNRA|nr:hypothetical protein BCR43DRAFT_490681 [Syncephalastrum racemosum]
MLRLNPLYLEQVRVRPPTPPEYKQSSPIKEECDNGALSPSPPPPEDELPPCSETTTEPIQDHSNVSSRSEGSGSSGNEVLATSPKSIPVPPPPPPKDVSPSHLSTSAEAVSPSSAAPSVKKRLSYTSSITSAFLKRKGKKKWEDDTDQYDADKNMDAIVSSLLGSPSSVIGRSPPPPASRAVQPKAASYYGDDLIHRTDTRATREEDRSSGETESSHNLPPTPPSVQQETNKKGLRREASRITLKGKSLGKKLKKAMSFHGTQNKRKSTA